MANLSLIDTNLATPIEGKAAYTSPTLRFFGTVRGLTLSGGGTRCDGVGTPGNGMGTTPVNGGGNCGSDPSIKENIVRVGTHSLGFGLYLFDYKPEFRATWGDGRQFGVMADEVKSILPKAVATHSDGYLTVDYTMLGISRTIH